MNEMKLTILQTLSFFITRTALQDVGKSKNDTSLYILIWIQPRSGNRDYVAVDATKHVLSPSRDTLELD